MPLPPTFLAGLIKTNRFTIALAAVMLLALVAACSAQPEKPCVECGYHPKPDLTFAVLGEFPYGDAQLRQLPQFVSRVNADPDIEFVFHVGDIKAAGPCSTGYYSKVKAAFDQFQDPLVYTFGDNEWSDCSYPANGGYDPLERLAALRATFIPSPGHTLGRSVPMTSQADTGFPENVSSVRADVSFAVFHTVGHDNGLRAWAGHTGPTDAQHAEERTRSARAEEMIKHGFEVARQEGLGTVVLATHANMFPTEAGAKPNAAPYASVVRTIAQESARFGGRVYLFNADGYDFATDHPLSTTSRWPSFYSVPAAENLTRVTFNGTSNQASYLKVLIRPASTPAMTWTQVSLKLGPGTP